MPARPLQPCPACGVPPPCCPDDPFSYSLVNGPVYENDQVAINFECPPGFTCIAGTYVIPAGRIRFIPNGDTLRLQCCQSEIVRPVPPGATAAQIGVIAQAMVNACALQAAQCAGEATINQGSSFNHGFNNTGFCVEAGCPPGQLLGYTGSAPFLGNGLTMECGRICIAPAIFTSTSVAAANTRARNYILSQISFLLGNGSLQCGYWNAEQICEDETIIEACTFFSQVDQEDANNLALASCPSGFTWDDLVWNNPFPVSFFATGSGSGAGGVYNANVTGNGGDPAQVFGDTDSSKIYTGPLVSCHWQLQVLSATLPAGTLCELDVQVNGGSVFFGSQFPSPVGTYDFDFDIPASVGAVIYVATRLACSQIAVSSASMIGTLSVNP